MPLVMRVAFPPAIGIVYRSPRMSKTIVWPLGETSSEIQDASSVVNLSDRVVMSGRPFVREAAFVALSFCAVVCAEAGAVSAEARQSPVATRRRSCFMDDLQRGQIRADVRSVIRGRTVCSNGDGGPASDRAWVGWSRKYLRD